ncbi:MAG TPA: hypothetical protein VMB81_07560 [Candidatus Sulfotelmatobacter sp.]|nr:hypothetical protein [Candidatus Sulfotelmatobacter sp.]
MGFGLGSLLYYAALCRRHDIGGRCLVLGRQDVHMTFDEMCTLMVRARYFAKIGDVVRAPPALTALRDAGDHLSQKAWMRERGYLSDKAMLAALGFLGCDSVDVSAYEQADFIHDLNLPGLAAAVGRRYDTVLDPGTLEHVFDLASALANLFDVLEPGGIVIHNLAFGNHIDHGFYQFSPDFMLDYYEANGFEILGASVSRSFTNPNALGMVSLDYFRGALDAKSDGGMDSGLYYADLIARKTAQSTKGRYRVPDTLAGPAAQPFPMSALIQLCDMRARFGLSGRCLVLGAHPNFIDAANLRRILPDAVGDGTLPERVVLRALGFDDVTVLDTRAGPGVDLVADLNQVDPALAARGPFDFVLDWGAASRLFRFVDYFRNLLAVTSVDGAVWHIAPSDNLFARGPCMFSPTLLHDFYTTNSWDILEMHWVHVQSWHDDNWFKAPYTAGALDWMCFGSASPGAHLVSALVRRRTDSTADRVPQQSWFVRRTDFAEHLGEP